MSMSKLTAQASAAQRCLAIIAENSKSFSFAARFLPREKRVDAAVLYAWCRRVDDAVDEVPAAEAAEALKHLFCELDWLYDLSSSEDEAPADIVADEVLLAFRDLIQRYQIPKIYPLELLKGMGMDVDGLRYRDHRSLYLYCFRVASVVGLMMSHIMGIREDRALHQAAHLGVAMQLTNICRDVSEDWNRGRLYLPLSPEFPAPPALYHEKGGLRFQQVALPAKVRAESRKVIRELLDRAANHYQQGDRGIAALPWRAGLAIRAAGMIYSDIGRIILKHGCDPEQRRAVTSKPRKIWLAVWAWLRHCGYGVRLLWKQRLGASVAAPQLPESTLTFEEFYLSFTLDETPSHCALEDEHMVRS